MRSTSTTTAPHTLVQRLAAVWADITLANTLLLQTNPDRVTSARTHI